MNFLSFLNHAKRRIGPYREAVSHDGLTIHVVTMTLLAALGIGFPSSAVATDIANPADKISPDVATCIVLIEDKARELKPLAEKLLASKNSKITPDIKTAVKTKRDQLKLDDFKTKPPTMLTDCNRKLSDVKDVIRLVNEKLK